MIRYLVNKGKSPKIAAKKAAARIKKGLPPKKIKGIKVIVPGKQTKDGKPLFASKLTKKQIKKMKPKNRKILLKRVAKAAKQNAKSKKIVIPGLNKNPIAKGSVSNFAKNIMKNKKLKNYESCNDDRILYFKDTKYINATCKKIFGESMDKKCDKKTKFCGMCCSHHVGLSFKNHYKKCFNTCENLIRGVKNVKKDDDKKTEKSKPIASKDIKDDKDQKKKN